MELSKVSIEMLLSKHQFSLLILHNDNPLQGDIYKKFTKEIKGGHVFISDASSLILRFIFTCNDWEGFDKSMESINKLVYSYL